MCSGKTYITTHTFCGELTPPHEPVISHTGMGVHPTKDGGLLAGEKPPPPEPEGQKLPDFEEAAIFPVMDGVDPEQVKQKKNVPDFGSRVGAHRGVVDDKAFPALAASSEPGIVAYHK